MKILHITPDIYEGGVASLIFDLGRYQIKHGNEVSILCVRNDSNQQSRQSHFEREGFNIIYSTSTNVYSPKIIFAIKRVISLFDIVHVHLFPNQLYAAIAFSLLPKRKRPILITTEHSTYNNRRAKPILRYIDRWFYKKYKTIICISPDTSHNLKRWLNSSIISDRIITINNGIDLNKFKNQRKKHSGIIRNVIMVSRLEYPKDPLTLVKAIARCPDNAHATFVGSGPLDSDIRFLAQKLEISERVHLLGNRTDVPELLANADIGVLSTVWDGFGLVAVEYMASGLPVIASNVEGLRDVVDNPNNLFNTGDDVTLAKKITDLISDLNYYEDSCIYSTNRAQHFSSESMNAQYLKLYNDLLHSVT